MNLKSMACISIIILICNSTVNAMDSSMLSEQEKIFIESAKSGDRETLIRCLTEGVNCNVDDDEGITALMHAAKHGHEHILCELLSLNTIDINYAVDTNDSSESAVTFAALRGHKNCVKMLLKDPRFHFNPSYIHDVLYNLYLADNAEMIRFIIQETKHSLNQCYEMPWYTLLIGLANFAGDEDVALIKYLLESPDVNVNVASPYERITALMVAASQGLYEGTEPSSNYNKIVNLLIDSGKADVNAKDHEGETALFYAVKFNHVAAIKTLLKHAAVDFDSKNNKNKTVFGLLTECVSNTECHALNPGTCNCTYLRQLLLKKKMSLALQDQLFQAIESNNIEHFKLLIKNMSLHVWDKHGNNPLHKAVTKGNVEIIKYILCFAPSLLEQRNNKKVTPLGLAVGKTDVLKHLLCTKSNNGSRGAIIQKLITAGAAINSKEPVKKKHKI